MIEDPGEIAQLASEFVSSLDNVPQEVQHIIKEIEHKDGKVQELLPKMAAREAQLRDIFMKKEASLTDADKTKIERLTDKIRSDYARADEWNSQKESLAKDIWRTIAAHSKRLNAEIAKISPAIIEQTERALADTLPSQAQLLSATSSISGVVLASLKTPGVLGSGEQAAALGSTSAALASGPGALKRKFNARESATSLPNSKPRTSSTDRTLGSPGPSGTAAGGVNAHVAAVASHGGSTGGTGSGSHPKKSLKHSGLSTVLSSKALGDDDPEGDLDAAAGEEKDDRVYCHCQRVSFGEMIGCDSDDCPYEWFHLTCVGLSKPLPQTWYCADCSARIKEAEQRPVKKRKKVQQKEGSQPA